jgi:hypothetical protein
LIRHPLMIAPIEAWRQALLPERLPREDSLLARSHSEETSLIGKSPSFAGACVSIPLPKPMTAPSSVSAHRKPLTKADIDGKLL